MQLYLRMILQNLIFVTTIKYYILIYILYVYIRLLDKIYQKDAKYRYSQGI